MISVETKPSSVRYSWTFWGKHQAKSHWCLCLRCSLLKHFFQRWHRMMLCIDWKSWRSRPIDQDQWSFTLWVDQRGTWYGIRPSTLNIWGVTSWDLTQADKSRRMKRWQLVETGRREGKRVLFIGVPVFIDGKEVQSHLCDFHLAAYELFPLTNF